MESLRAEKNGFNKELDAFHEAILRKCSVIDQQIRAENQNLNNALESMVPKMRQRDQALFKRIKSDSLSAALEWLKTKYHLKQGAYDFPSMIRRNKHAFGYNQSVMTEKDRLVLKQEERIKMIREMYSVVTNKAPRTKAEHFGVEIECYAPEDGTNFRNDFQQFCIENKVKGANYKSDGSISAESGCFPFEITVLIPRDNIRDLEMVCKWLAKKKARVNKSCGLHVHLDFRNRDNLQQAANRLANALPFLSKLVPKSRRSNSYCRLERNSLGEGNRYAAINLQSYHKYKTLEVRLHSGTVSFEKITSWIMILSNIIENSNFSKAPKNTTVDDFIELLDFKSDNLNYYIYNRFKKFNSETSVEEEIGEE